MWEYGVVVIEIVILCLVDVYYFMYKVVNLFGVYGFVVVMSLEDCCIIVFVIWEIVVEVQAFGVKYFIVVCNMMIIMFGLVDYFEFYMEVLEEIGQFY